MRPVILSVDFDETTKIGFVKTFWAICEIVKNLEL